MNAKYFFAFFFLLGWAWGAAAEPLTVRKIAVTGTETTDPALVRAAFLEVDEGDTLPAERLAEVAELVRHRLVALGSFGSVEVYVVPSRAQPGMANLVAEVTEGFTGRFGGGNAYALAGLGNLGGQGKDLGLGLGWNRQSLSYADRFPGWSGGSWALAGGNLPRPWVDPSGKAQEDHAIGGEATVGQDWGWGWSTDLTVRAEAVYDAGYGAPVFVPGALARLTWRRAEPGFSPDRGAVVTTTSTVLGTTPLWRQEADARVYLPLVAGLKTALRVAGSGQLGSFGPRQALVFSGLDGVRKGWDSGDLARARLWTSAELRWEAPALGLFDFTSLSFEPALVADAGIRWNDAGAQTAGALGLALRVFVNAPIFVPLRFEQTLDDQNRWTFFFGVQAPY